MDAARIDMQVLSLTSPGTEQLEAAEAIALAREANDIAVGITSSLCNMNGNASPMWPIRSG